MNKAKPMNLCLDWLYGSCCYQVGRTGNARRDASHECRFFHELPPMKTDEKLLEAENSRSTRKERLRVAALPVWKRRKERLQKKLTNARKPKARGTVIRNPANAPSTTTGNVALSISMETQTTQASVFGEDMSDSGSRTEVYVAPSAPVAKSVEVPEPKVHQPVDYEPAPLVMDASSRRASMLEPQMLALNANAAEYAPHYAPSHSGSISSEQDPYMSMSTSTSHTPAPSVGEPVYYTPVAPPTVPSLPSYSAYHQVQYVNPLAAMQEKNAQLTAQVRAYQSSQDKVHREYQAELVKVQQETARMMRLHQNAMQRMAAEQLLRLQYERQLAELRQQKEHALNTAKLQEQRALANAARLQEIELQSAKAVKELAVVVQEVAPMAQPHEEVVQPEVTNTYFTSAPITSVVPTVEAVVPEAAAPTPKPEPAKPLSERVLKQPVVAETVTEVAPEPTVSEAPVAVAEEPVRQRKRRARRRKVAEVSEVATEEPVPELEAAPVQQLQVIPEAPVVAKPEPVMPEAAVVAEPEPVVPEAPLMAEPVQVQVAPAVVPAPKTWANLCSRKKAVPTPIRTSQKTVTRKSCRCIFEVFDWNCAKKEGCCLDYFMSHCKSETCTCWKLGCEFGDNCKYVHKLPTVRKVAKISREEQQYRERKSGVKKTRMTKRDRFYRKNKLSLEAAKKRAQKQRNQSTQRKRVTVSGTGIALRY